LQFHQQPLVLLANTNQDLLAATVLTNAILALVITAAPLVRVPTRYHMETAFIHLAVVVITTVQVMVVPHAPAIVTLVPLTQLARLVIRVIISAQETANMAAVQVHLQIVL
jgi:hypothetical protein